MKHLKRMKGRKPLHNEKQRLEGIRSLDIVNEAVLSKSGSIFDIIEEIKPNVICLGYDQRVQKQELEDELKKEALKPMFTESGRICRMSTKAPR